MKGRILGILQPVIEDYEIMRMISSDRLSRMLDCGPLRRVAAGIQSATEDCETMRVASSYRFSTIEDYENHSHGFVIPSFG